ncbi:MAG TPA: ABC transporter permease [Chitinophagaceae bacterium]|nr:ABC transporter permease [Chitinophagaceae bacterium]
MFKNYLKTALRNLWKNKGFSAINIIGLATGVATCLVILLFVRDELSYDKFNKKADNIYRINEEVKFGDNHYDGAETPTAMGQTFKKDFPQVEAYTRMIDWGGLTVKRDGIKFTENKVIYADSTLFDVFTLPMIDGDPKTALVNPNSLVITETTAKKYFNTTKATGKTIDANDKVFKVTGVIKDIPQQSHFHFDFFVSLSSINDSQVDNWLANNYHTYLVIQPGTDINRLSAEFNKTFESYVAPLLKQVINLDINDFKKGGGYVRCYLTPLMQIHLHSNIQNEIEANGSIQYVYIFSAIALFILLIACVNFMNLSTARSANRAKEVGVRKVLGSLRKNLVSQFLTESLLISGISFILAIGLLFLLVPFFNNLALKNLSALSVFSPVMLVSVLLLMLITGLLAGSYPAFFLSSFQPIAVLKGKMASGFKGSFLRNSLVVFQFFISILLMVGTAVIFNQLSYMRHKDVGFAKDHVLVIKNTFALGNQAQAFRKDLTHLPGIKSTTYTGFMPVTGWRNNDALFSSTDLDIKKAISSQQWEVDDDYIPTLQMKMKLGRNFSKNFPSDSSAVIINEAAAAFLNTQNPIGMKLYRIDDIKTKKILTYNIIGVIKNFNFNTLREEVTPLALYLRPNTASLAIRMQTQDITGLLTQIKNKWKVMVPSEAINYSFMDEDFNKQYQAEERTGVISITFSVLAILIACLGLFGLVTYAAEQRIKEIGIRKVLGANLTSIITMLSGDFVKLVAISFVIAVPVAWFAMNKWLQGFAYRINIPWWLFAAAGLLALLIALATVSFQAVKAALANPVKSLRTE